ncbi:MAG: RNA-binding protein [Acidobacteriota bacterium]
MGCKLYVGNLPYSCTDDELRTLFGQAGAVASVQVMRDTATGRARGFGFVEMATEEAAQKAVADLNQFDMQGRALVVNEARPKGSGGSFGAGGGGGGRHEPREPRW